MRCRYLPWSLRAAVMLLLVVFPWMREPSGLHATARAHAEPPRATPFPAELVEFQDGATNPVFTGAGPGHWDAKIRERGWILRDGDMYHLWYTGYDGTREGIRQLGYATSPDGLHWTRYADNPLCRDLWIEDMMVVKHDGTYTMFAEGRDDQAQWLTSKDPIHWHREGTLDIRYHDGKALTAGPFGTPTVWLENGTWYLFYEQRDAGVWLATSKDLKVWTHLQDAPVLVPGPRDYDQRMIALNQIIKHDGVYFAYYHGSGSRESPRTWSTDVARSSDLVHWQKYEGNPIVDRNKSSGIVVSDGRQFRLYTMHDQIDVYFPRTK